MKRHAAAVAVLFVAVALASPAAGKGARQRGFTFDGYIVPGERISSMDRLRVQARALLRRAPLTAYLDNMDDARVNFGWASPALDNPIYLGRVRLHPDTEAGYRYVAARLSFAVPNVPAGLYEVRVCDAGCDRVVHRFGAASLYVVAGPAERRLRNEIDDLYSEMGRWESRVVRLHGRLNRRSPADRFDTRIDIVERDLVRVGDRVTDLARSSQRNDTGRVPASVWIIVAGAGAFTLGLAVGRGRLAARLVRTLTSRPDGS